MALRRVRARRDTAANWIADNPVLLEGEIALEEDTFKLKMGDGVTAYVSLPYYISDAIETQIAAINEQIALLLSRGGVTPGQAYIMPGSGATNCRNLGRMTLAQANAIDPDLLLFGDFFQETLNALTYQWAEDSTWKSRVQELLADPDDPDPDPGGYQEPTGALWFPHSLTESATDFDDIQWKTSANITVVSSVNSGADSFNPHGPTLFFSVGQESEGVSGTPYARRAEVTWDNTDHIDGTTRWWGWEMYAASDFPWPTGSGWCIMGQLHPSGGTLSPTIALQLDPDMVLRLITRGGATSQTSYSSSTPVMSPFVRGVGHKIKLKVTANTTSGSALTQVYLNGSGTPAASTTARNRYVESGDGYWKWGMYRTNDSLGTAVSRLWLGSFCMSASEADVNAALAW